jgi:hypothetical protein
VKLAVVTLQAVTVAATASVPSVGPIPEVDSVGREAVGRIRRTTM